MRDDTYARQVTKETATYNSVVDMLQGLGFEHQPPDRWINIGHPGLGVEVGTAYGEVTIRISDSRRVKNHKWLQVHRLNTGTSVSSLMDHIAEVKGKIQALIDSGKYKGRG